MVTALRPLKRLARSCLEEISTYRPDHREALDVVRRESSCSPQSVTPSQHHLDRTISWLMRAQAATGDGGVAWGYRARAPIRSRLRVGWVDAYPETTGYIIPTMLRYVVFQHNVENMIWRRHAENARNAAERFYLNLQATRMFHYERDVCRTARHVIAVSREDAMVMQQTFGLRKVSSIPTGVDVECFTAPKEGARRGLVFVGSMDWLPNIDGMRFFCSEVLPLIRRIRPDCPLAIVGREPSREMRALAGQDPLIQVTGTVPDVRPCLWEAAVSVVPLRIGGGTRMKIYEAMAAGAAVVSTTVGAEGLDIHPRTDIRIADTAEDLAAQCLELLDSDGARRQQADAAWRLVSQNFGWDSIARQFESILESYPMELRQA